MLMHITGERRAAPRSDEVKRDVTRRQVLVARRLSPIVGVPSHELLDYRRADRILSKR